MRPRRRQGTATAARGYAGPPGPRPRDRREDGSRGPPVTDVTPRLVGNAVEIGVDLAGPRRVGGQVVQVDHPVAVPVDDLSLEPTDHERVRQWADDRVVESREDGVARVEEVAAGPLNPVEVH